MKVTVYELLGKVKDEPDRNIYIKYFDRVHKKEDIIWACKENIIYNLDQLIIELNDEVEIIKEDNKIEKIPIGLKQNKDGIFNTIVKDDIHYELNEKEETICIKINEIIDKLNKSEVK